jgi:CO dehydrogenase maturation factor
MEKSIKLAITGKGGVGKTTVASLLCRAFTDSGYSVLAVDADPDANLATAIGFKEEIDIPPLTEMKELIEERTGAKPGAIGSFFKLNPKVDDLPEKLWKEKNGIKLLRMGTVKKGGGGCICPESAMLKTMVQNLLLFRKEAVIMDMEAGIEHLGRATAQAVNPLIVVVEPGKRSMETARQIKSLAKDIKLVNIAIIANKVRSQHCVDFLKKEAGDIPILGFLPFKDDILKADMESLPPWEVCPEALEIIKEIARKLVEQKAG